MPHNSRSKLYWFALVLLTCCCSCTRMILGTYGIRSVKPLSDKAIVRVAHRYGIEKESLYTVDSGNYYRFLRQIKKNKKQAGFSMSFTAGGMIWGDGTAHGLGQPLQYLLFDRNGKLVSWHINCITGGWPNLKWNRNGNFDIFPPPAGTQIDSNITLELLQPYWRPVQHSGTTAQGDYTCVVYWARFMGRQSRRLVHLARGNAAKVSPGMKITYLFVNDDNYFYHAYSR